MSSDTFDPRPADKPPQRSGQSASAAEPLRQSCYGLSARELEVVGLVVTGQTDKGIALTLGIRPKTVGKHLEHIRHKMECSSRTEIGIAAIREGLFE